MAASRRACHATTAEAGLGELCTGGTRGDGLRAPGTRHKAHAPAEATSLDNGSQKPEARAPQATSTRPQALKLSNVGSRAANCQSRALATQAWLLQSPLHPMFSVGSFAKTPQISNATRIP
ncbi:hypothetical protein E4U53_007596, partial [Claviceps sorghi]